MAKIVYRLYGKILNGIPKFYNDNLYRQTIIELEDKEFELVMKEKHYKVSNDQYGYYHAAIIEECMKDEMFGGWTHDDIDDMFSSAFLTVKRSLTTADGNTHIIAKTISKGQGFSKKDMSEFIEKCILWCAEHGIIIHSSEQYYLDKYKSLNND